MLDALKGEPLYPLIKEFALNKKVDVFEVAIVTDVYKRQEEHYPHSMANAVVAEAKRHGLTHEEYHSQVQYVRCV